MVLYILYFKMSYLGPYFCTEAYMGNNGHMALNLSWEVRYLSSPTYNPQNLISKSCSQNFQAWTLLKGPHQSANYHIWVYRKRTLCAYWAFLSACELDCSAENLSCTVTKYSNTNSMKTNTAICDISYWITFCALSCNLPKLKASLITLFRFVIL